MQRLLIVLAAVGLFLVACGSGAEPQGTGTATSERAEREATVSEQQDQGEAERVPEQVGEQAERVPEQVGEQAEQVPDQVGKQAEQVPDQVGDDEEQAVVELPAEIVGEHKGVRSEGNVLGEPDAPVLIEHFGDFT